MSVVEMYFTYEGRNHKIVLGILMLQSFKYIMGEVNA
jgi:hypothetical protein